MIKFDIIYRQSWKGPLILATLFKSLSKIN